MSRHASQLLRRFGGTFAVLCSAVLVAAEPASPKTEIPYHGYVTKRVVVARSGPGMDHYPTDALLLGERVEVLEEDGKWLALRAPRDSFSWISAEYLRFAQDKKSAEVLRNDVTAWVGSNIEAIERHASQVTLRRGERVVVLETRNLTPDEPDSTGTSSSNSNARATEGTNSEVDGNSGPKANSTSRAKTWVKIEPPTGERRWVPAADIGLTPPADAQAVAARRGREGETREGESLEQASDDAEHGWTDRSRGISRRNRVDDLETGLGLGSDPRSRFEAARRSATGRDGLSTEPAVGSWTSLLNFPSGASFDDRLARVQLALSRAVAGGGTVAQMDLLEQQAARLVQEGRNAYERGRATRLLESVREFRKLARRRQATMKRADYTGPKEDGPVGSGLASAGNSANPRSLIESVTLEVQAAIDAAGFASFQSGDDDGSDPSANPYLAEGWLMPVSSPSRAAPPFVLMNAEGHPVAFVTPAPGVNLRRYVDKQVGIMGQRAFGVLDRQHVVAHRAIELARHRDQPAVQRASSPWIRTRDSEPATRRR
jgi:uncharacterized protein YgiM (DUF1202 family)